MKQLAFYFDASSCTGCKSCQIACKDRNHLEVGLLWRRVYEIAGGGWQKQGVAWISTVYAYNLSISCNHCEQPICAEVCPAAAIQKRPDGIVYLDSDKCIGCRYCSWACPYSAPQYDERHGHMTKCNFCAEEIERGSLPACVAACPMRALDFGERAELEERYGPLPPVYPSSDKSTHRPIIDHHLAQEQFTRFTLMSPGSSTGRKSGAHERKIAGPIHPSHADGRGGFLDPGDARVCGKPASRNNPATDGPHLAGDRRNRHLEPACLVLSPGISLQRFTGRY